ncbi:ABC-2 type transport system ATP-binding protein [Chitinophaga costaii]|uniref:ABC-2 type transport system ATP-binding protein n=1 Tax=Chitinophaga costaii TaxID=1335309 RepID=A0A1C4BE85_9BACT|nr:ATP-binding cassette domain-containing protein [Chitinophaga costaii]PUZ27642.1 DUF4162 domain-containing protein [Chitinophaga costaii]SCC05185.1 ABC-2 type transport system ATP-binding protein [Chitinophaga costaii]
MHLLQVSHLKKYYATHKAVDDISFDIPSGSIFGLLGPNGAGKTTLLRMITGIFFPDEGSITFDGRPYHALGDSANIGYMPEERGLYKKMKVEEQVLYLAQLKGMHYRDATEKINYWFARFDINSWRYKKIEELSKGMQQKVQFISTILHGPKLLILDEPFSGLDPINASLIKNEIFNLAQQGTTIIFSTHRMGEVEEICNSIVLVNKGKKILDGGVAQIKQQFKQHLFKIAFGQPINPAHMATYHFTLVKQEDNAYILKKNPDSSTNDILSHFIRQEVTITHFEEILPSLNEIFIQQVQLMETAGVPIVAA